MNNLILLLCNPKPYSKGLLEKSKSSPEEKITLNCDGLKIQIKKCDKQYYTYQSFKDIEKCFAINELYNKLCNN